MSLPLPRYFPPPQTASRSGLLGYDRRLTCERMTDAYQHGIFPWPSCDDGVWRIGWYSPDPRAILPLNGLHLPRRLTRKLRTTRFSFTFDQHFPEILRRCASEGGRRRNGTWLSPKLRLVLEEMHAAGQAHSVEVYDCDADGKLCGGLYGVSVGGVFSAESMYHLVPDASKSAIAALVKILNHLRFQLLDIQVASPHMEAMGAITLARSDYLEQLSNAVRSSVVAWPRVDSPIPFDAIPGPLPFPDDSP